MAKSIPVNKIERLSENGVFVRHPDDWQSHVPVDTVHRDDYYLFAILLGGTVDLMLDFKDIAIQSREGIIVSPGQVHLPKLKEEIPTAWSLFVASDLIPDSLRDKLESYSLSVRPLQFVDSVLKDISSLFGILKRNISNAALARSLALSIVGLFCEAIPNMSDCTSDRYIALTLRFKRMVDANYVNEKRPGQYASHLNVSRVYLNEAVRASTGMSIGQYIRSRVIINAKRLLTHTSMNINEIARSLGYDDASYFERMFRKETGITPSVFRKNIV